MRWTFIYLVSNSNVLIATGGHVCSSNPRFWWAVVLSCCSAWLLIIKHGAARRLTLIISLSPKTLDRDAATWVGWLSILNSINMYLFMESARIIMCNKFPLWTYCDPFPFTLPCHSTSIDRSPPPLLMRNCSTRTRYQWINQSHWSTAFNIFVSCASIFRFAGLFKATRYPCRGYLFYDLAAYSRLFHEQPAGPAYLWSGFMNSSVRRWTGQFILYVGVIRKLGQGCQLLVFIVMGARPIPTACTPVLGCLKWPNENLWASSHSNNILFHRCAKLIRYFGTGSEQVVDSLYRTNEHGPECLKSLPSIGKME